MRLVALFVIVSVTALPSYAGQAPSQSNADELVLQAAGLSTDADALRQFFRDRTRPTADLAELLPLARQLGDPGADKRAQAKARLLGSGTWAVPALRHVVNDLENPLAAKHARHCLECLQGKRGTELTVAAARLLAARQPAESAGILLEFLTFAGDPAVVDGVKSALGGIATRPGKVDPALLAALSDPQPLRRAVAAEVLAGSGRAEVLPAVRKVLADGKPQVRLRAALALAQQLDETTVGTLIDLLVELQANERRQAEQALHQLAGAWAPTPPLTAGDDLSRKICHEAWVAWWRSVDGPALKAAFRRRTLTEQDAVQAQALVEQLGSKTFAKRDRAAAELIAQGTKVTGLLGAAVNSKDQELVRRVGICLQAIARNEARDRLPLTAPRLLAIRAPADASEALLDFLPFANDSVMSAEVVKTLTHLARTDGQAHAALIKALGDPSPVRRLAAVDVLAGVGGAAHPAVRELLTDADPQVRLQVALALVRAQDRAAVPALIDMVADLPGARAWEADDVLRLLAGDRAPPRPAGDDAAARKNLRAAWQSWWKDHGAGVKLVALEKDSAFAGLTVVAEITSPAGQANPKFAPRPAPAAPGDAKDRLVVLDRAGKQRWQIDGLNYPMDFQLLPGGRVLIAEYYSQRVTERDTTGRILWEVANLPGAPINVQRLANGNTFIAIYNNATVGGYVMEVDRQGKTVTSTRVGKGPAGPNAPLAPNEGLLIAAHRTAAGHMSFLFAASTACVRVDAGGNEIARFPVGGINSSGVVTREGNIDGTPKGHILVMQNLSTLTEFDADGKVVWQVNVPGHRATRLANGNTLVASETAGVVELDAAGKSVWQYQPLAGYRAVRARQAGNVPPVIQAGGK